MGVLNVTPDSFSDGGRHTTLDAALRQAGHMITHGADVIDVGGESTRPGAGAVSTDAELERVIPVIEALARQFECVVSIDTSKPEVMQAAIGAGAGLVNDVRALCEPGAIEQVARAGVAVCVMHMQGSPGTMQRNPAYDDVLQEVRDWLALRLEACVQGGIRRAQILIDPGFGFGKRYEHNCTLLRGLGNLAGLAPVLAGVSRKRMIGELLGDATLDRDAATAVASLLCIQQGASIVRVHDVAATAQALAVWQGLTGPGFDQGPGPGE